MLVIGIDWHLLKPIAADNGCIDWHLQMSTVRPIAYCTRPIAYCTHFSEHIGETSTYRSAIEHIPILRMIVLSHKFL